MGAIQENRPELQLRYSAGPTARTSQRRPYRLLASVPAVPADLPDKRGALLRFQHLMCRLDRWLDAPLQAERDSAGHTVWILDAVGYRVDRAEKAVYPVVNTSRGVQRGQFDVDLLKFLCTPAWIEHVIRRHELSDAERQQSIFQSKDAAAREQAWMSTQAFRFLLRDPRFRDLTRSRLPRALDLDRVVRALALATRPIPERDGVNATHFTWVWRHERALRAVARENPRLLPFVAVAMREGAIPRSDDPVAALHGLVRGSALKAATWRYLLRSGVRWLRPAWGEAKKGERTKTSIEVLRAFELAGYPPRPPQWLVRAWLLDCQSREGGFGKIATVLPAAVLAACCQGMRVREFRHADDLRKDLRLVKEWGLVEQPALDKLQKRAGWPWARRRAREWDRRGRIEAAGGPGKWAVRLPVYESDGLIAKAIDGAAELVDVALEFRNCAADFGRQCRDGEVHMFVIGSSQGPTRLALAAIANHSGAEWGLMDIKGPRNAAASADLLKFAEGLVVAFRASNAPAPTKGRTRTSANYFSRTPPVTCFLIDEPR